MISSIDCLPCFIRQALDGIKLLNHDSKTSEQVLKEILRRAAEFDLTTTPARMGQQIHRLLRTTTGTADPWREIRRRQNDLILAILPQLRRQIDQSRQRLATAIRLAIAGNIIDLGVAGPLNEEIILAEIYGALQSELIGSIETFQERLARAGKILYLADNAGEIVIDRLLIEEIQAVSAATITMAVRGTPVINDAIITDAQQAGITDLVEVIDNGSDAPATLTDNCSREFLNHFNSADLIISKGQGNFESLSDFNHNIIFLFKAKCAVISNFVGVPRGTQVIRQQYRFETEAV